MENEAKEMDKIFKDQFVNHLCEQKIDTVPKLKKYFGTFEKELKDSKTMEKVFSWAFDYVKDGEQKQISTDFVTVLLAVLIPKEKHVQKLIQFLAQQSKVKSLRKDEWTSILRFSREISANFSNYDSQQSWPLFFDEFVQWCKGEYTDGEDSDDI